METNNFEMEEKSLEEQESYFMDDYSSNDESDEKNYTNNYISSIEFEDSKLKATDGWEKIDFEKDFNDYSYNFISSRPKFFEFLNFDNPYLLFSQFFDNSIISEITTQTNLYFQQNVFIKNSKTERWKDVDNDTIRSFLGILLLMGLYNFSSLDDFWKNSNGLIISSIKSIISEHRFKLIWRFFHLSDNSKSKNPKNKVFTFLAEISKKWRQIYIPTQNLSLDETIIAFNGRSRYKQYEPRKPDKWGLKAFSLAEADSGYMLNMILYLGKRETLGKGESFTITEMCMNLCNEYFNKNHILYLDSYYVSIPLLEKFYYKHVYCIGTVRKNRKGLPSIPELSNGEVIIYFRKFFQFTIWKNKKEICLLSTKKNTNIVTKISSKKSEKNKPAIIELYNSYMHGVDRNNQFCSYYGFDQRHTKWWKCVFIRILEVSTVNSYILFSKFGKCKLTHKEFRLKLIETLLSFYSFKKTTNIKGIGKSTHHILTSSEANRDCFICSNRNTKRKRTNKYCKNCYNNFDRNIYLCSDSCFNIFHDY